MRSYPLRPFMQRLVVAEWARHKDCPKVGSLTAKVVIDFELQDPDALAELSFAVAQRGAQR